MVANRSNATEPSAYISLVLVQRQRTNAITLVRTSYDRLASSDVIARQIVLARAELNARLSPPVLVRAGNVRFQTFFISPHFEDAQGLGIERVIRELESIAAGLAPAQRDVDCDV